MSEKKNFSGDILSSFEHKAKINTGNVNDEVLLAEIEEITSKIDFPEAEKEYRPFGGAGNKITNLREDKLRGQKENCITDLDADGYVCVSGIMNKEGK